MKKTIVIILIVVVLVGIAVLNFFYFQSRSSSDFNFIFKYGRYSRNILDTFNNTYTKDTGTPPSIIDLKLTQNELKAIYNKMIEINFFSLPEEIKCATKSFGMDNYDVNIMMVVIPVQEQNTKEKIYISVLRYIVLENKGSHIALRNS